METNLNSVKKCNQINFGQLCYNTYCEISSNFSSLSKTNNSIIKKILTFQGDKLKMPSHFILHYCIQLYLTISIFLHLRKCFLLNFLFKHVNTMKGFSGGPATLARICGKEWMDGFSGVFLYVLIINETKCITYPVT